jgi:hypothetical protein
MISNPWRVTMSNEKLIAALPLAALFAAVALHTPPVAAQEGMVVSRDPQTGQLRAPTATEMQTLSKQRPASLVAPTQPTLVARKDRVRQVRLGENAQVFSVVNRDANGKLVNHCVQGEAAADAALQQSPAATEEHGHEAR